MSARPEDLLPEKAIRLPDSLPDDVRRELTSTCEALVSSFSGDLAALVLFGSSADGRMRATSDVNLIVVLSRLDVDRAHAVAPVLQIAQMAIELHPLVLLEGEVQSAAEAFAVKFDDISHRRFVVWGRDPFVDMAVPREAIVQRLRQELLNTALRLRTQFVVGARHEEHLIVAVANAAAPLRRAAFAILQLRGQTPDSPRSALESLAGELEEDWRGELALLSEARENARLTPGRAAPLLLRLSQLALALRERLAELER